MNSFDVIQSVYNKIAKDYQQKRLNSETSSWNNYLEVPAMQQMLTPLVLDKHILDLGCGTGILTQDLLNMGATCVEGVDISENMIELARANLPDLNFAVANLVSLPYEDSRYDVVASSLVMHYLQDLIPAFKEQSRILKPSGDFVFSMHHPVNYERDKNNSSSPPVLDPYFSNESYYWPMCGQQLLSYRHSFGEIVQALNKTGFVVINLTECRPIDEAKSCFSQYEFTSQYPTFCVFHAKKGGGL